MGDAEIKIVCYADDDALIAESEDDLQRCKLELDGKAIEQKMIFSYLSVELSCCGDIEAEVRDQTSKEIRIAGCVNAIWCNKSMGSDAKSRIYKTVVRTVMIYTAETRPETSITGKTMLDRKRIENIGTACMVKNINEWVANRKKEWNEHISRMDHRRLVRIARGKSPLGRSNVGKWIIIEQPIRQKWRTKKKKKGVDQRN
uniref:Reverse transcriptase domain-containing protein n=1 Tax=Dendroctonus ponderosae TaxID=77166 RepID=A0AAR5Q6A8_DENPD